MASSQKYGNSSWRQPGYDYSAYTYYPVVIIGAGQAGIAMGCQLKEVLGFDQFRIFDRQCGLGGTWWINRYPGVECDIPALFYSFSFCPNLKWSQFFPPGKEIVSYLQRVCDKYQIVDKIQLNTDIKECKWLETEQVWQLTIQHLVAGMGDLSNHDRARAVAKNGASSVYTHEETVRAKIVVSGVGGLVEPNLWPSNIPGIETFQGDIFHSARWREDIDLKDKNVVVIGTGCSAAQLVPELTKTCKAKSVTQVMRSPPWVVPKAVGADGDEPLQRWLLWLCANIPGANIIVRKVVFALVEHGWRLFGSTEYSAKERAALEAELLAHMKKAVPAKYHEILTPNYSVACKRRIFDSTWFAGLNDPRIELTTLPLTKLGESTITLGPKRLYPPTDMKNEAPSHEVTLPVDVIVLANGFQMQTWGHQLKVTGRNGIDLHDVFDERGGPQLYMGSALDGFPNFFALAGPNTATGHSSVVLAIENMIVMTLKLIKPILTGDVYTVEVKKEAELEWARETQSELKKRVWHTGGCLSWYFTENGWNSTMYPHSQIWFGICCRFLTWSHWELAYTRKGLIKKRVKTALTYAAIFTMMSILVRINSSPTGVKGMRTSFSHYAKFTLSMTGNWLLRMARKV